MKLIIICISLLVLSFPSVASYQLSLATSHITRTANYDTGSEVINEETRSPLELKFGTVMSSSIYLGGIYNMGSRKVTSASGSRTESLTGFGATVGYDTPNWYFHLSYYLSAELDLDNDQIFKEGKGFQLDIGKKFKWGSIFVIPQIAYTDLSFDKLDNNGTEVDVDSSSFGGFVPQIAFMYEF